MLVLSRKINEVVQCDLGALGTIKIMVVGIVGNRVKLGIDAPCDVDIERKEIADSIPAELRETLRQARRQRLTNANWEAPPAPVSEEMPGPIPEKISDDCCLAGNRQ